MQFCGSKQKNIYTLRLDPGDEMHAILKQFARDENIQGAYFSAIGGVKNISMGYYSVDDQEYKLTDYPQFHELVSLTGNIAWKDGEPLIHTHGVLSDTQNNTLGGHIASMEVAVTCEIFLQVIEGGIERVMEEGFHLPLWDFSHCGA